MPVRKWLSEKKKEVEGDGKFSDQDYQRGYLDALDDLDEYVQTEEYENQRRKLALDDVREALFGHGHHG